jgi:hypothetical protein
MFVSSNSATAEAGSSTTFVRRCGFKTSVEQWTSCGEAEELELSADGIGCHRAEICHQALHQLTNFRLFEIAERALTELIDSLERLSYRDPQQVEMHQKTKNLQEGVEAAKRLVRERCKIRDRVFV